ncbi:MAG: hypothetical protein J6P31_02700 [Oscillospiraceae bacterium]|nr:hypothetical protein [Oscillospiraceae bacterium]
MAETGNLAPSRLVLLVTVVNKGKGTFFADLLKSFDVNLQMSFVGSGTARRDLIDFLGLKDERRSILFSVVRAERVDAVLAALEERFQSVNSGTGIAFTIPMSSVMGKLSYGFLSNERRLAGEEEM